MAASFAAQGHADGSGWYWSRELHAQWQFFDLAWAGEHLAFTLTLGTRGWVNPPPPVLGAVLTFSSFGCPSRTQTILLQRVAEQGPLVGYFGQVVLARRDLGFGSYLVVSLRARAEAEVGVHAQALRLVRTAPVLAGAGGMGGPFLPTASDSSAHLAPSPSLPRGEGAGGAALSIRKCASAEDAPYLAPGTYRGQLGWPGPGHDLDSRSWFRVNLHLGQRLELRLISPRPVVVRLLDPTGQEVGRLEGQGQLGLIYEAQKRGAYSVCIAIVEAMPTFSYTVEVLIRR
ncbi:MAG: hypothetical protein ACK42E_00530 [Candidatus Bipolaricaulaceae bacterium]